MKKVILSAGLVCLFVSVGVAGVGPLTGKDRAKAHFNEHFTGVSDANWSELDGKELFCMFHRGDLVMRVFYSCSGNWEYTVKGYMGAELTGSVKDLVNAQFDGYQINYVNEVLSENNEPIYMINIENEKNIKVIRVSEGNIDVRERLKKS